MLHAKKIVLHTLSGDDANLEPLVAAFIKDEVAFIGVVGPNCARIETIIDELCVGDGTNVSFIVTTNHPEETLEEVIDFAKSFYIENIPDDVDVVVLP